VCHGARDPAAVSQCACPSAHDTDRLSSNIRTGGGGTAIPLPSPDRPLRFPGRTSPVAPSPGRFGCATACYVDQSMGSRHRPVTVSGAGQRSPPSPSRLHWQSNSVHTSKRYALRRNRVSIETRNCNSGIQYNKNSAKQQIITNRFRLIKLFCFNSSACKQIRKINQPNFSCYNKSTTISTVQYMTA